VSRPREIVRFQVVVATTLLFAGCAVSGPGSPISHGGLPKLPRGEDVKVVTLQPGQQGFDIESQQEAAARTAVEIAPDLAIGSAQYATQLIAPCGSEAMSFCAGIFLPAILVAATVTGLTTSVAGSRKGIASDNARAIERALNDAFAGNLHNEVLREHVELEASVPFHIDSGAQTVLFVGIHQVFVSRDDGRRVRFNVAGFLSVRVGTRMTKRQYFELPTESRTVDEWLDDGGFPMRRAIRGVIEDLAVEMVDRVS